jgi:serine protease Do
MTDIDAIASYDIASDASRLASTLRRTVVEIRSPAGGGAGIIWGGRGLVVTNAHCVRRDGSLTVEVNGETHSVRSVAFARDHDLALIRAPSVTGPVLELRDLDTLRPGELVFAYGHPLGVSHALAMGALHGVVRDKRTGDPRYIAADIRLAPGNSGGPLVDAEGKLVGVNSMIVGGLGVAIPASVVHAFVTRAANLRAA